MDSCDMLSILLSSIKTEGIYKPVATSAILDSDRAFLFQLWKHRLQPVL
jgi:hypothetical protein